MPPRTPRVHHFFDRVPETGHARPLRTLLVCSLLVALALLAIGPDRSAGSTGAFPSTRTGGAAESHLGRAATSCKDRVLTATQAIRCMWPRYSRATALRVAECESTASAPEWIAHRRGLGRWAADYATGTHIGIFQLGPAERRRHGRYRLGSSARKQVAAALSLYRERGWQPWDASRRHCWHR